MAMQQKQKIVLGVLFVLVVFMYIFFSQTSNEMSPKLGDQVKGADQFEYPTSEFLETHGRFWNDENIRVAREYQIDLSKQLWSTNRNQRLKDFLDFFNSASNNVFHIKPEDLQEEGYHRYSYSVTRFPGATPTIRLRDFSKGFRSGLTTVDLKFRNGDTMAEMFDLFGAPAPQFLDTAVQKVEQDVHACDVRWSRGTRLFLDYSPAIETVDDVAKLFPDLIESAGDAVSKSGIKKQSMDVYYWQASYRSSLDNGLEYKITFTFMYPSIEDAFAAESMPKKDGEFSIRLFGENNGYSRKFDTEHLRIVDDLFEELLWSSWNVDPEMDCLLDVDRDPEEAEVWRQPII